MGELSSDEKKKLDKTTDQIAEDLLSMMMAYMKMTPDEEKKMTSCAQVRALCFVIGRALGMVKMSYQGNFEEYLSLVIRSIVESMDNTYMQLKRIHSLAEDFSKKSGLPMETTMQMIEKNLEEATKRNLH